MIGGDGVRTICAGREAFAAKIIENCRGLETIRSLHRSDAPPALIVAARLRLIQRVGGGTDKATPFIVERGSGARFDIRPTRRCDPGVAESVSRIAGGRPERGAVGLDFLRSHLPGRAVVEPRFADNIR